LRRYLKGWFPTAFGLDARDEFVLRLDVN